jgi:hypothetical protein
MLEDHEFIRESQRTYSMTYKNAQLTASYFLYCFRSPLSRVPSMEQFFNHYNYNLLFKRSQDRDMNNQYIDLHVTNNVNKYAEIDELRSDMRDLISRSDDYHSAVDFCYACRMEFGAFIFSVKNMNNFQLLQGINIRSIRFHSGSTCTESHLFDIDNDGNYIGSGPRSHYNEGNSRREEDMSGFYYHDNNIYKSVGEIEKHNMYQIMVEDGIDQNNNEKIIIENEIEKNNNKEIFIGNEFEKKNNEEIIIQNINRRIIMQELLLNVGLIRIIMMKLLLIV